MDFQSPLIEATLLRRYKRFLADVRLADGAEMTVHVANPGSMMGGLADKGRRIWLSDSNNPKRKLRYSWEVVETAAGARVGVNTALPNKVVEEAILAGHVPALAGYDSLRREVKYGENSRIDLLLEGAGKLPCYVEVKSVTLSRRPGLAEFPDAKTARGTKHLAELGGEVKRGSRALMLYLVNRTDCDEVAIASDIDPAYNEGLLAALTAGVETVALGVAIDEAGITVNREIACKWKTR